MNFFANPSFVNHESTIFSLDNSPRMIKNEKVRIMSTASWWSEADRPSFSVDFSLSQDIRIFKNDVYRQNVSKKIPKSNPKSFNSKFSKYFQTRPGI